MVSVLLKRSRKASAASLSSGSNVANLCEWLLHALSRLKMSHPDILHEMMLALQTTESISDEHIIKQGFDPDQGGI